MTEKNIKDVLLTSLQHSCATIRMAACAALSEFSDPEVTAALLERLKDDLPNIRAAAALSLATKKEAGVASALIDALQDSHQYVRVATIKALATHPGEEVDQALMDIIPAPGEEMSEAIKALSSREGDAITDVLFFAATQGFTVEDRLAALQVLIGRPWPNAAEVLIDALSARSEASWYALQLLEKRQDPNITPALLLAYYRFEQEGNEIAKDQVHGILSRRHSL